MKKRIEGLLRATGRDGIDQLLTEMEQGGFYESPCSGGNHLAEEGGLAKHSLNVYEWMCRFAESATGRKQDDVDAVIICALLHDLGKMGQYGKSGYTENILKGGKRSDSKPYEINKELVPVPHEVRSVAIASRFIPLTEEEQFAILMHNGMYGDFRYVLKGKETPLYLLLHFADMWASRVAEGESEWSLSVN